ncbi:dodecin domain-containing protein [bacterium]|nr:dodecin domain-containing protein [bacterium]
MDEHIYKHIEVTGTSAKSVDDAIRNAIKRAGKSVHGMRWFEMTQIRGDITENDVAHWQVTVKIGFRIDD